MKITLLNKISEVGNSLTSNSLFIAKFQKISTKPYVYQNKNLDLFIHVNFLGENKVELKEKKLQNIVSVNEAFCKVSFNQAQTSNF